MTQSLQIGPLAIPWPLLLVFVTVALALYLGRRAGRKLGLEVEPVLFRAVVAAVIAARLGFVWQYRDAYLSAPLGILDIRDGGWSAEAGLIVGWLYALSASRVRTELRKPVLTAMAAASAVWLAGTLALSMAPVSTASLPRQSLAAPDGTRFDLAAFAGRPTVVNFWATWCPPCLREMPLLQQAQRDHPGVNFVFLNQGESAERVNQFLARHGLALRNVLLDPKGEMGAKFGQNAFPTTLFFDARGQLVGSRIGELSLATLTQRLETLATQPAPPP